MAGAWFQGCARQNSWPVRRSRCRRQTAGAQLTRCLTTGHQLRLAALTLQSQQLDHQQTAQPEPIRQRPATTAPQGRRTDRAAVQGSCFKGILGAVTGGRDEPMASRTRVVMCQRADPVAARHQVPAVGKDIEPLERRRGLGSGHTFSGACAQLQNTSPRGVHQIYRGSTVTEAPSMPPHHTPEGTSGGSLASKGTPHVRQKSDPSHRCR